MPEIERLRGVACFEGFELDLRSAELRLNDDPAVKLADQPFRILLLLLQRPREVVLREEIRKSLWPNDTVVEFEHSISAAMNRLRQALGDTADNPRYIETLAGRGYRWKVPVEWVEPNAAISAPPPTPTTTQKTIPQILIGKKVSHYRILELLGGGGMGVVYRAEDLRLGRSVAIKFLGEELIDDQGALERFGREARAISALDHPNICPIYEFDEYQGQPFIVMEFMGGKTLREHLADCAFRLDDPDGLDIAIQLAAGLEAAHEKAIVHRDIKPANIFITDKNVAKILDFGVAKVLEADEAQEFTAGTNQGISPQSLAANLTRTGMKLGTAGYMSPEQVRGERLDTRTDIFSFGIVLYEMATGEQAFVGETVSVVQASILNDTPKPVRELNPNIPHALERIIVKALEKDRDSRYQSAAAMCVELEMQSEQRRRKPRASRSSVNRDWKVEQDVQSGEVIRFGPYELSLETGQLRKNGVRVKLSAQPIQVLTLLLANQAKLVTREQLQAALWHDNTYGDFENGLNNAINRLRENLGDSATDPKYIETIPGRGYRFIGEVVRANHKENSEPIIQPPLDDTAVRGRLVEPIVVRPKRPRDEPDADATRRNNITSRLLWFSAVVVLGVAGTLVWRSRVSRYVPSGVPEPKATQLIANSFENPLTSSAISPNGKYIAFTDKAREIRIKLLETGETQIISEPQSLKGNSVDWTIAAWFPDSTRFIVNARPHRRFAWFPARFAANSKPTGSTETWVSEASSIWIVSVLGKTPLKLRDNADAFSVSPDGSWIAFGTNPGQLGDREIWLMDAKGLQARKLYDAPERTAMGDLQWSSDGQRVIYLQVGATNELVSRDLRGGPAIRLVQYSDWGQLIDFVPLPDGRLIYAYEGNLWQLRMDPRNGGPTEMARQITNWVGLWLTYMSVTSDGKHLAFQRSAPQTTVYVADIDPNGTHLSSARHFTVNEYSNLAETWTPDSNAVVFRSPRDGQGSLFKQTLDSDIEEPLVNGAENVGGSAISPDGSWLFYMDCTRLAKANAPCERITPVMRIPIHGGEPHRVLTADLAGRPRCTVYPADLCVIAEQSADGKPLIFTAFDALKGRGKEIARFETEAAAQYHFSLSPDGTRVAILKFGDNRIHTVPFNGETLQQVVVKQWTNLAGVFWAADGKGWFTASRSETGVVLLHVDLQGEAHLLWSFDGGGQSMVYGLPSPDGRHLAIVATARNNNVWLMENF